jgi:hypothetical protein
MSKYETEKDLKKISLKKVDESKVPLIKHKKPSDKKKDEENSQPPVLTITIDFAKIENLRKQQINCTKSIYKDDVPYDNSEFPRVRFPTHYSVPDHLLEEFKHMFPSSNGVKKKGKIGLVPETVIRGRSTGLLAWLVNSHWKNTKNLDLMAKIILHKTTITLSNLDWLCTNYSKQHGVHYRLSQDNPLDFNMHESYNGRLELHLRALFDVFARNVRILIEYETDDVEFFESFTEGKPDNLDIKWDNKRNVGMRKVQSSMMVYIITSTGQINYFTWAHENKVIDFCMKNVKAIEDHYDLMQNSKLPNGKRQRLSEAPPSAFKVRKVDTIVVYDSNVNSVKIDAGFGDR